MLADESYVLDWKFSFESWILLCCINDINTRISLRMRRRPVFFPFLDI